MPTAPTQYTLIPGSQGSLPGLVYTDANGSLANVTTPWVLNSAGVLVPWPTASGTPQVSLAAGTAAIGQAEIQDSYGNPLSNASASNDGSFASAPNAPLAVLPFQYAYNESTWDRVRNNTQGILLASAARTASLLSPTITNYNRRGVLLSINVTAMTGTSPSLVVAVGYDDPIVGSQQWFNGSSAITAPGVYTIVVYPSSLNDVLSSVVLSIEQPIPRFWSIYCNISGTNPSVTFSVNYYTLA